MISVRVSFVDLLDEFIIVNDSKTVTSFKIMQLLLSFVSSEVT